MITIKKTFFVIFVVLLSSCSNDDSGTPASTTPTSEGFTWSENGNTTVLTLNNPYASAQYKTIFALRSGLTIYEINLTSFAPGTYSFAGTTNAIYYNNNGSSGSFSATGGSVIITANANNKLSGTFTATGSGNGVTSLSGQFTQIKIQ
jgi:hypothetical protein